MANCILLHKQSGSSKTEGPSSLGVLKLKKPDNKELYQNNPFARLTEYPVFIHNDINDNLELEAKTVCLGDVKLGPCHTLKTIINDDKNKKKILYFKGKDNNIEIQLGPTMYNPHDFSPVRCELIRMAVVNLTDKQVERLVIGNRYYSELNPVEEKIFYMAGIYDVDKTEVTWTLTTKDHNLNVEEYNIYCELVKRLGIPRGIDTLTRWLNEISSTNGIIKNTEENKNYMYTIIRRNGKYVR